MARATEVVSFALVEHSASALTGWLHVHFVSLGKSCDQRWRTPSLGIETVARAFVQEQPTDTSLHPLAVPSTRIALGTDGEPTPVSDVIATSAISLR